MPLKIEDNQTVDKRCTGFSVVSRDPVLPTAESDVNSGATAGIDLLWMALSFDFVHFCGNDGDWSLVPMAYRSGRRIGVEIGDAFDGRGSGVEVPLALHLALPLVCCNAPFQRLHL